MTAGQKPGLLWTLGWGLRTLMYNYVQLMPRASPHFLTLQTGDPVSNCKVHVSGVICGWPLGQVRKQTPCGSEDTKTHEVSHDIGELLLHPSAGR